MRFESRWNSSLPSEKGWLLLSDIDYKNKKNRVRVVFRHAIFNANQYSLRLYCREHDALWAYSTSILYGTGSRSYLLIHLKKIGPLQCWIKFGNTFKINTTSSLEKNLQSDIALQTNISF